MVDQSDALTEWPGNGVDEIGGLGKVADVPENDIRSALGETDGDGLTDAPGSSRHQRDIRHVACKRWLSPSFISLSNECLRTRPSSCVVATRAARR